jgi:MoaA/NifB/PqqE/SkfB family radical SAM enzyme
MDFEKYFKKGFWDNSKNIYICGIDTVSFGLIKYLQEKEQTNIYFIDEGFDGAMELWGMVAYPISIISEEVLQTPFFLVTDPNQSRRNKYIKMIRKHYGTNCMKEIYNATEIRIDVSGICNLRCPSCQVGNHGLQDFVYKNRGFMDESSFQKILKKIAKEFPDNPAIYFFVLGEPLLNEALPQMLDLVHKMGWIAIISTNLSVKCDVENLMEHEPDVIKISVSGYSQGIYETTHRGGDIELVKRNMKEISDCIKAYGLPTRVMVSYHIYKNNMGEEQENMKKFCEECGFWFYPVKASYFNMLKKTGLTEYSEQDIRFIETYYESPEKMIKVPEKRKMMEITCRQIRDKLYIDWDGAVMLCELFHKDGFYKKYLDVSIDEIRNWQKHHWICKNCHEYGCAYY